MTFRYTLTIDTATADLPDWLYDEILEGSEPHDLTLEDQILRWLGGHVGTAEDTLADDLPDGWSCHIDGHDYTGKTPRLLGGLTHDRTDERDGLR
jgi:hypothetical protein